MKNMNVKLRDYQVEGIDNIMKSWENSKSVLFQMPTGTGKTFTMHGDR